MRAAKDIVHCRYGVQATDYGNAIVILDLRDQADDFLDAVNETQQQAILNKIDNRKLSYVSELPRAAKVFVNAALQIRVEEIGYEAYKAELRELDLRWLYFYLRRSPRHHIPMPSSMTKRWVSGYFVVLPLTEVALSFERGLTPSIPYMGEDGTEYVSYPNTQLDHYYELMAELSVSQEKNLPRFLSDLYHR